MKNILVLLHDDAGQEARLQAALDLTRSLDGHLICLDVVQYPVMGGFVAVEGQGLLLEDERGKEANNRSAIRARLSVEDVPWSMAEATGDLAACVARAAGLADLIVLNRKLHDRAAPNMFDVASRVVLQAGRPILAMSETAHGFDVGGHAIIAWNGSPPCMAALTATVPLLMLASSVSIVEVANASSPSAEEAAVYLSRYGVRGSVKRIGRMEDQDVASALETVCTMERASYCVMGAYGHSRLREVLLGGVTRRMLASSTVPLLLAH